MSATIQTITIQGERQSFQWQVQAVHEIGLFSIVEYIDGRETLYRAFVAGKDTCVDDGSLDRALITAMCHLSEGFNSRAQHAAEMICRMLQV